MIALQIHPDGILLPIRAQPGARKNGITGEHDGRLKVAVTQAAEKGKANAAIQKVLAKELGLKKSQLSLVSGPTSPLKVFLIGGVGLQELQSRIGRCWRNEWIIDG